MCALGFSPQVPDIFKGMFSVPTLALPSIMACRVFRAIKLGVINEFEIGSSSRTPLSRVHLDDISFRPDTFETSRNNMEIRVIKTTHIQVEADSQDGFAFGKHTSSGDEDGDKQFDRV